MQQFREVSRTRTTYSTETHTSDFILNTFWNGKPVHFFFPGEVLSGGDGVPREQVLQQSLLTSTVAGTLSLLVGHLLPALPLAIHKRVCFFLFFIRCDMRKEAFIYICYH